MNNTIFSKLSIVLIAFLTPTVAGASGAETHWSEVLRSYIAFANEADWRLATVEPGRCPTVTAGSGVVVDSITAYQEGERARITQALGLGDLPQIAAIATNSPADRAGMRVGDEIVSIGDSPVSSFIRKTPSTPIATQIEHAFESLPLEEQTRISLRREGNQLNLYIEPVARCGVKTVVKVDDKVDAYGDQHAVAVTSGLIQFVESEDELALVIGHEFAHAILKDHLDRNKIRGAKKEDAADLLGAKLARCAGYDVGKASEFWQRMSRRNILSFLPTFTHRSPKARYRKLVELGPRLNCEFG